MNIGKYEKEYSRKHDDAYLMKLEVGNTLRREYGSNERVFKFLLKNGKSIRDLLSDARKKLPKGVFID